MKTRRLALVLVTPARSAQLAFGFLAVSLALIAPNASGASHHSKRFPAQTIARVGAPIHSVAQDGSRIAWISGRNVGLYRKDCTIAILAMPSRKRSQMRSAPCETRRLVLGNDRVLAHTVEPGTVTHINVYTWAVGLGRGRHVAEYLWEYDGGSLVSDLAADGAIHVYGTLGYRTFPRGCDEARVRCEVLLVNGSIVRVGRTSQTKLLDIPPAALAVNADRIAFVPMQAKGCACNSQPTWAPDGQRIAFVSRRIGPDTEISTVPSSAGMPRDVTANWHDEHEPDWSPDGQKIVMVASDSSIRTVRQNGTEERVLYADCSQGCSSPAWSPDGSRVAFAKSDESEGIHVMQADGSDAVRLAEGSNPTWSPDGRTIAFEKYESEGFPSIWLIEADGSNQRPLGQGRAPAWSRAGMIAFENFDGQDVELYVINPDGSGRRQLTDNLVSDRWPDWSPNGEQLAFIRAGTNLKEEIYVMNAGGGEVRRLTNTPSIFSRFAGEVRRARDGAVLSRFTPTGSALEVALSREFVAVLVEGRRRRITIELFRPASGARLGTIEVRRGAHSLSISGKTAVFATEHAIWMVDAAGRGASILSQTRSQPIGLSIEGRRVVWAENGKKRSRIRAVRLPAAR